MIKYIRFSQEATKEDAKFHSYGGIRLYPTPVSGYIESVRSSDMNNVTETDKYIVSTSYPAHLMANKYPGNNAVDSTMDPGGGALDKPPFSPYFLANEPIKQAFWFDIELKEPILRLYAIDICTSCDKSQGSIRDVYRDVPLKITLYDENRKVLFEYSGNWHNHMVRGERSNILLYYGTYAKVKDKSGNYYDLGTIDESTGFFKIVDDTFENSMIKCFNDVTIGSKTQPAINFIDCDDIISNNDMSNNMVLGCTQNFIKSKDYTDITELANRVDFFNITGICKVVFQENNSLVWKAFDDKGDIISLSTTDTDAGFKEEVRLKGNSNLNTFIDKFNDLKNIKFGFLLERAQDEIDKIQMQFDAHGSFDVIRPEILINRTNLQINSTKNVKLLKTNILINQ